MGVARRRKEERGGGGGGTRGPIWEWKWEEQGKSLWENGASPPAAAAAAVVGSGAD